MTGIDQFSVEDSIEQHLNTQLGGWLVVSGSVEDAERLAMENGVLNPYVVLRFGDSDTSDYGGSFKGARYDDHEAVFDALCVAATDREARQMRSFATNILTGYRPPNAGEVSKTYGGGEFSSSATNTIPQYYVAIASFKYTFNLVADGTGYDGT